MYLFPSILIHLRVSGRECLLEYMSCFSTDKEVCAAAEVERRIPQLKEVFEKFPKVPINVDIKFDSDKLISEVKKIIMMLKMLKFGKHFRSFELI